jgi:hypothetical protein
MCWALSAVSSKAIVSERLVVGSLAYNFQLECVVYHYCLVLIHISFRDSLCRVSHGSRTSDPRVRILWME